MTKAKITAGIIILAVSVVLSVIIIHTLTGGLSREYDDYGYVEVTETGHMLGEPFGASVEYRDMDTGRYGIGFSEPALQWGYNTDDSSDRLFLTGTVRNISGRGIADCDLRFSLLNAAGAEIGGGMTWVTDIEADGTAAFACELSVTAASVGGYADIKAVKLDWAGVD